MSDHVIEIKVCLGTSGSAAGGEEVLRMFKHHISEKGVEALKRRLAGEVVTQENSGMSKGEWREFEGVWG